MSDWIPPEVAEDLKSSAKPNSGWLPPEVAEEQKANSDQSSVAGTASREAVKSVIPGAAAMAAGEGTAALLAPTAFLTGGIPVIPAVGGALAGAGTFMMARNAQNKVLNAVAPNSLLSGDEERGMLGLGGVEKEATGQAKADEEHPWARLGGGLLGGGGPLSVSSATRNLETLATKEGWSGIRNAAQNLGNKEFMKAAQNAASPEAKALQQLHIATHVPVGVGVNAGIGISQGQSPGEALGTAAVGLVQKPWFGSHGVFGKQPASPDSGKPTPKPKAQPETEEPVVPLNEQEQAAANEAQETISKVDQVTDSAVQSNVEAGNTQTAQALSEVAKKPTGVEKTPEVNQVSHTATQSINNENQEPLATSTATETPNNSQSSENVETLPKVEQTDVLPGVSDEKQIAKSSETNQTAELPIDGERSLQKEDRLSKNRPLGESKIQELKEKAIQAEQAGDEVSLNQILLEARVRASNSKPANRPMANALAEEVRQRIARMKGVETSPAEVAPAQDQTPDSRPAIDELDQLGDMLLGNDVGSNELTAKSPSTVQSEEDPRNGMKRILGLSAKGAGLISRGAKDFDTWSQQMVSQFGETPHLKDIWDYANEYVKNPTQAKEDLGHIENWTSDPKEHELRMLEGTKTVIPRQLDMDNPEHFNPKLGFEYDPETNQMVVRPRNFDPIVEAKGVTPRGDNGGYSLQQISNYLNKYFAKEEVRNAQGKILRTDKSTVGDHVRDGSKAKDGIPMPTDRLENALKWYKLNVENRTAADNIASQTSRTSPDALLKESVDDFNVARESVPEEKRKQFDDLLTRVQNYLTLKLGGTIERKLTSSEELAHREENKRTLDAELAAQERKEEAKDEAEKKGKVDYDTPVLPSQGKSTEAPDSILQDEDHELYVQPEGKEGKGVSRLRNYPVNRDFRGFDENEREAIRWFALSRAMAKVAAELRGDAGAKGLTKINVKGIEKAVGNDDLIQAREEIRRIRERQKEGGTATVSANAKVGDSDHEYQDALTDSGLNPEDDDEVLRAKPEQDLLDREDVSPQEKLAQVRDIGLQRLATPNLPLHERLALVHTLMDVGALGREEIGKYAEEFRKIPSKDLAASLALASHLRDSFSPEEIIDGKYKDQELGAKASRLASVKTEGEVPFNPHDFVTKYAEVLYPGVEFYVDPDLNSNISSGTPVGSMEAWVSPKDSTFGVRYDPKTLEGQIRGMSKEQAQAYLLKTMEEEVLHISSMIDTDGNFDNDAANRTEALGNKMSMGQRRRVARFYLGEGASREQMNAFMKDPLMLGWEYTRMMHQMMRTGKSTEVLREAEANPDLLTSLMGYVQNAMRWVKARLAYHFDPTLKRQLDFMTDSYETLSIGLRRVSEKTESGTLATRAAIKKIDKGELRPLVDNPTARLFVERNEKRIDWNKVKTPEQLTEYTVRNRQETAGKVPITPEDMYDMNMREAKAHRFLPGQGGDAARKFLATDESLRKRACDKKALELTEERQKNFDDWQNYLEQENSEYSKDPFWKALSYEMLYNALGSDRGRGLGETLPLNRGVLADLRSQVENLPKNQNLDLLKMYRKGLAEYARNNTADEVALSGDKKWVYIPSRSEDPNNFAENVDKLKSLSHEGWCTRTYNAEPYLKEGGMWILTHGDSPAAAVRMLDGGDIAEIQGRKNNGTIPEEYGQDIKALLEARKDQLRNYWKFEIKNPAISKDRFMEILKQERGEDLFWAVRKVEDQSFRKVILQLNRPELDAGLAAGQHLYVNINPISTQKEILSRVESRIQKPDWALNSLRVQSDLSILRSFCTKQFRNPAEVNDSLVSIVKTLDRGSKAVGASQASQEEKFIFNFLRGQTDLSPQAKAYVSERVTDEPLPERPKFYSSEDEDPNELIAYSPATRASESIYNDPKDPTYYEETTFKKIKAEAGKYINEFTNPKDALDDLQKRGALISPEAKFPAARMIQESYEKKIADLNARKAAGEVISSPDLTDAQRGRDRAYRMAGEFKSQAGQGLVSIKGDSQYAASTYVDQFLNTMLGGSIDDLTAGKINVDALKEGLASIKQQVADVTVNSAKRLLNVFGVTDPAKVDKIKSELGDLNSDPKNFKGVIGDILGLDPSSQKVAALTQQLNSLYNAAHARMVPSRLSELVKNTYGDLLQKGDLSVLSKNLATQLKLGRYDEDRLNSALLDSLGITGYDVDTVKKLRDQVNFIQSQPEGSAQRNLAADKLKGALANMQMNQLIKSGGKGKVQAAFDLIPDLFRSAVLTSPATTTMHGAGGLVNTRVQAIFDAYGNFQKALNSGASFQDAAGFFKDFMDTCFIGDKGERGSPLIREAWRAVRTGTIGQGLSKGVGKRGADLHGDGVGTEGFQKYCKALAIPGRLMSAWDAINAGTAQEVQQKYAMRAALLNMGEKGPEVATAMKRVFAPTKEDLQLAKDALDKEVKSGAFDSFTKPEQFFLKGERLEQLHKQIQLTKTGADLVKLLGSEDIQSAVDRYTYKGKPQGVWGAASDLLNTLNKNSKVTTLLVPFTNIVGHLMNTSLDFTPLGFAKAKNASLSNLFMPDGSKYAWPKMVEGSPEQIALMTKSIVGTAATAFITSWFLKELHDEEMTGKAPSIMFYGSGPKDPSKRKTWRASGAQPDTMKIGNNYFPYKTLPAISLLGAALGAMHDMYIDESIPRVHGGKPPTLQEIEKAHEFTWEKAMSLGTALAFTPLTHEYLSGLRNIITIAHDPEGPGASNAVIGQLTGSFSQLTNPSLLRTLRNANPASADNEGNVANLDLSTTTGKLFQFIPGYLGYNQQALNILGDPIEHKFFSPLTDRWAYAATAKPDPIVVPLVNNGLYLPEARKSTPLIIDTKGTLMKVGDAGDDAWRNYQIARGYFLKKVLTPDLVDRLTKMDRLQAQSILMGPSIAGASAKYAQAIVERDILKGKIKVKG